MKLYHFTAGWMLESILKEGLTKGCVPISIQPPRFNYGFQWLTSNDNFNQSWCEYLTLPYNRNDYRIVVKIPDSKKRFLINWIEQGRKYSNNEMFNTLSEFGDPENWYIYQGKIKPQWIKNVLKNHQ